MLIPLPRFDYSSFEKEANSMKWRFSRDELKRETVGVFRDYRTGFHFSISNSFAIFSYEEMEQLTNAQKDAGWETLGKKVISELQNKNCRR
jgi:hypothetical protein